MDSKPYGAGWRGTSNGIPVDAEAVRKLAARVSDAEADALLTEVCGDAWTDVKGEETTPATKSAREIFGNVLRPRDLR